MPTDALRLKLALALTSLLVAIAGLWPGSSLAQEQEAANYRPLVDEGLKEFEAQNFAEARALFLRAHALSPSARTHRALGLVEFELRSYVDSIAHLEAALASDEKPLTPEQREETESILARANGFVGRLLLQIKPDGAELRLDSVPVQLQPGQALLLPMGEHTLEARAAGFERERRALAIKGGEHRTLSLTLVPSAAMGGDDVRSKSEPKRWYKSPWLWVSVGIVLAGTAGGVTYALLRDDPAPQASGGSSRVVLDGP